MSNRDSHIYIWSSSRSSKSVQPKNYIVQSEGRLIHYFHSGLGTAYLRSASPRGSNVPYTYTAINVWVATGNSWPAYSIYTYTYYILSFSLVPLALSFHSNNNISWWLSFWIFLHIHLVTEKKFENTYIIRIKRTRDISRATKYHSELDIFISVLFYVPFPACPIECIQHTSNGGP